MKKNFQRFIFASIIGSLVVLTGCDQNGDMKDQNKKARTYDRHNGSCCPKSPKSNN